MLPPAGCCVGVWHRFTNSCIIILFLSIGLSLCRFYSSPYSLAPNRMITQTSLSPYMHSPVSSYQVGLWLSVLPDNVLFCCYCSQKLSISSAWTKHFCSLNKGTVGGAAALTPYLLIAHHHQVHNPSWMHHQSYLMQPAVSG